MLPTTNPIGASSSAAAAITQTAVFQQQTTIFVEPDVPAAPKPVEDKEYVIIEESELSHRRRRIEEKHRVGGMQALLWPVQYVIRPPAVKVEGQFDADGNQVYTRPLEVREQNEDFKLALEARMLHNRFSNHTPGIVWIPDKFHGALGPDKEGEPTMDEQFGCKSPADFQMDKFLMGGYRGIYGGGSHVFATKQNIIKKPHITKHKEYQLENAYTYVGPTNPEDCHFVSSYLLRKLYNLRFLLGLTFYAYFCDSPVLSAVCANYIICAFG
jgi:hypothetical protein